MCLNPHDYEIELDADQTYCLYPECTSTKLPSVHSTKPVKFPTSAQSQFCSQAHQSMAKSSSECHICVLMFRAVEIT